MNRLIKRSIPTCNVTRQNAACHHADSDAPVTGHRVRLAGFLIFAVSLLWLAVIEAPGALAQSNPPMTVGIPTVDANGVKSYPVTSVYQGSEQQIIRVLEPTNPIGGKPRRLLYVLPVDAGVDTLSSFWSDGLEQLRLLDVPNRFNMVLIAPSFNYDPWYGDNVTDPTKRMESFIINDLVPFGDTFGQGVEVPQRFLIGFSKSGNGVLDLIFRHPGIFDAAAAWDSPAQLSDISAFDGLPLNFGTQANYNLYNIPALVASNAAPFQQQNRLWISGDQSDWTADMIQLHQQLTAASIPHTWVAGGVRIHSWGSGWLEGAVEDLDAKPDFSLTADPATQTVAPGTSANYSIGITANGAFTGNVALSVAGLPTGATASFSPNPTTSSSTMTVNAGSVTPVGSYTLTVTAVGGSLTHTATLTLVVSTPDFTVGASPSTQTILQGSSTSYSVAINPLVAFNGSVTLSVSGLPAGAIGIFSPDPAPLASTLSVSSSTNTPAGSYTLTITGVSGTLTHIATVTLVVATPDFSLSTSPASNTVTQGHSVSYGVTISPFLGFAGQVSLSVSDLPVGASGIFSPNPATATSNLNVSAVSSTPPGTYTVTITGVSGALMHTTTVSLTVASAGINYDNKVSSGYKWGVTKITTPAFTIGTGTNRAAMILVAMSQNTATSVTASLGGVAGALVPGTDSGTSATIRTMIFQVINPPSGSQTATVSWTTSMNADVGVITVSGADPNTPINHGTFFATNTSNSQSGSVTITSNPGDLTASIGYTADGWVTPFTNQLLKWGVDASAVAGDVGPGTGTTTHTWTDTYAFQTLSVSGANFQGATAPDYTLSGTPSSQTVTPGGATSYGLTVSGKNGFTGPVALTANGLPTGATASFAPNPATTSSTLSATTASTTPPGTYTLTITGTSGALTHTTTVTLIVVAPDFALSASPVSQTVMQGSPTSYNVSLIPANGFGDAVTLSVSGLPTAASGTFAPNPVTGSSTLSVTTNPSTPAGNYTLTITGTNGTLTHTTTVSLVVIAPDFTVNASPASQTVTQGNSAGYNVIITPTNGFSGPVTFSVTGLPTGATASFVPNPATTSSILMVTAGSATPAGTYTLTITGTSGSLTHTKTVTLVVPAPDFGLSVSPSSQTVVQGTSTSYNVTINPTNGFSGQVTFGVAGLPTGASGSFTPNPGSSSSTLSVTTSSTTPVGSYTLTITGISGALTHTAAVTLVVNAPPDFTLAASPSSQTVIQGGATSYGLTLATLNGFSGQVTLSVTGLPAGATSSFSPNPATSSSTMSVTAGSSSPVGSYTLTITGVSGALSHTATVTLVVGTPDFSLSASPASKTTNQGGSASYGVTVTPILGFTGQVTLSATGLPSGASGSFSPNPATATSTLVVTVAGSTPTGTYTIMIMGVTGTLTHATTVSLTVVPAGVVYDNKASSGYNWGVTKITTPAFTVGTGTNRAAMIMVAMNQNTATNVTASLGGVAGTLVPGTDSATSSTIRTMIFQVINPPSGSQTAVVSWTTSMNADVGVITVSGADQTTPLINGTMAAYNVNSAKTASLTVTSSPGDLTATMGYTSDGWVTPFTNQLLKWGVDSKAAGGDVGTGLGTTTHTWTDMYAFQTEVISGANFKASSGQ